MVQSGHDIIQVGFASRRHPDLPVEVIERADIVRRLGTTRLQRPERLDFHVLVVMRSSGGVHGVDFDRIAAVPGRLIWVRPGQVQRWDASASFDATLVLARPAAPTTAPWFPGDPAFRDLDAASFALVDALIGGIRAQQAAFDGADAERRLLVALFEALVAVFECAAVDESGRRRSSAYLTFRDAIEADLGGSHDVSVYAARLGYSPRTLDRACRQATGQTAKAVLADRLLLEAKRLLVHTDLPASSIAGELGFSEATNFGKFFARLAGQSPGRFRAGQREGSSRTRDVYAIPGTRSRRGVAQR